MYEILLEDHEPLVVSEATLRSAWADKPLLLAELYDLWPNQVRVLSDFPLIELRRL